MTAIPGSNILNMAFNLIARTPVTYYKYNSRTLNAVGQDVTVYDAPVQIAGSWQAVPRKLYSELNLDFQKSYFIFYIPSGILEVDRDVSGDQIGFNGRRYQVQSTTDWLNIDGWRGGIMCVDIGVDNG